MKFLTGQIARTDCGFLETNPVENYIPSINNRKFPEKYWLKVYLASLVLMFDKCRISWTYTKLMAAKYC